MTGTVQEDYARNEGLRTRSYSSLDEAVGALLNGDMAAIIHDAPVLEYYAHTHRDQPVEVVGRLFEKDKLRWSRLMRQFGGLAICLEPSKGASMKASSKGGQSVAGLHRACGRVPIRTVLQNSLSPGASAFRR